MDWGRKVIPTATKFVRCSLIGSTRPSNIYMVLPTREDNVNVSTKEDIACSYRWAISPLSSFDDLWCHILHCTYSGHKYTFKSNTVTVSDPFTATCTQQALVHIEYTHMY